MPRNLVHSPHLYWMNTTCTLLQSPTLRRRRVSSEELRSKFVKAETTLFRVRYISESPQARQAFLSSQRFGGERVSEEDKSNLKERLMAASPWIRGDKEWSDEAFYRVRSMGLELFGLVAWSFARKVADAKFISFCR